MQPIQEWLVRLHHNRRSVYSHHRVSARRTFPSGGLPIIVVQHPAQSLVAQNRSTITSMRLIRDDQPVAETLMVAFCMIMRDEFVYGLCATSLRRRRSCALSRIP